MNDLTPQEQQELDGYSKYLEDWKNRAIAKFKAGMIEHRGEIPSELDLEKEIEHEVMDITGYNYFKSIRHLEK